MGIENKKRKVYVVGHKNPDTDSICSAIAYARLKNIIDKENKEYIPRRAGHLNEETRYVLDYFNVKMPKLLKDLRVQVKDVDVRRIEGLNGSVSIKTVWSKMTEENIHTLPVTRNGKLEGLITKGDIAKSYMDVYDSSILSTAKTQYRNIATTIDGKIVTGNPHSYLLKGKVGIAASSRDLMSEFIREDDLVILGNRREAQQCAIDLNVGCMIICQGAEIPEDILEQAKEKQIVIITTANDTFTVARQINQSIPVKYFMTTEDITEFHMKDFVDDVKDVMAQKRFRDFPITDESGNFLGFISRRRLLNCRKKQVILVDHNERNQAVDGIDEADVVEIIDHHRISAIETIGPVYFRNQPVGCTATIIYQMYFENGVQVDKETAGLLCSAIISDTLMFRSPTCTELDKMTAKTLANIAGLDVEEHALAMFSAGSNLKGKTPEEIITLDFKQFTAGDIVLGVGQISSMNEEELKKTKEEVLPYLDKVRVANRLDMIFFMLTNILTESSELICCGLDSRSKAISAFDLPRDSDELMLKGVVSRKKQLVPILVSALQQ